MVSTWIHYLDPLHRGSSRTHLVQRSAFGAELPAYIVFHAVLAYLVLGIGLIALVLRIPIKPIRRIRWVHPYLGFVWVGGTIWIAVTSIWCVYAFIGWDIVAFFIFSMYGAIQLGWIFMKGYKRQLKPEDPSLQEIASTGATKPPIRVRVLKWLHATAMIYSLCMMLGAGISFPFRYVRDVLSQS